MEITDKIGGDRWNPNSGRRSIDYAQFTKHFLNPYWEEIE